MNNFTIDESQVGKRLDVYIQENFANYSRSTIQRLLKNQSVLINGKAQKNSYKLKLNDNIAVSGFDPEEVAEINIPVLYEDDDCVVINKPEGILSHSKGALNTEATVASWLKPKLVDIDGERAGIVHRLDRGTSGVMICAKTNDAQLFLQKQFAERNTKKVYLAVIRGSIEPQEAIIDMPIQRNPKSPSRFKVSVNGKSAITHYKQIKTNGKYSLIELTPKTGRTHQLRVHLSQMKHPIVGDNFYNGEEADRLYLHAESLEILLPGNAKKIFTAKPDNNFLAKVD
jgi:23S rRNA pseudouridine1911/1915/1917 synthase